MNDEQALLSKLLGGFFCIQWFFSLNAWSPDYMDVSVRVQETRHSAPSQLQITPVHKEIRDHGTSNIAEISCIQNQAL